MRPSSRLVEQEEECGYGEPYLPLDVDVLFAEPTVALRGPWESADLIRIAPTAEDLSEGLYEHHLDFPGDALDPRVASAGVFIVLVGTLAYALGEGWHVVDALYFAVATLTTTSVADLELVLEHRWMKIFTVLYLLVGIGILVEILRRLGMAFVAVRSEAPQRRRRGSGPEDEPDRSESE